ncbi:hypothetical protein CSAL01_04771 [Colletotrichum salicis]|uniref:Uncharacterized protein n=1 Tax=Colletotrichum salicis TaxID=1209931 RepID=A0A135RUJ8_9PEZI|nr:hypothetical protein CSAL01_04771 [Colletotrichum salicis]
MSPGHRMSKRSSKRRHASPEPDSGLTEGLPIIKARRYPPRKDVEYPTGRHRSLYEPPPRSPRRHHRHSRQIEAKSDTDGDLKMIPMHPASPSTALVLRTKPPSHKKAHHKNDDGYLDIMRRRRKPGLELELEPMIRRTSKRRRSIDDTGREIHQQQSGDLVVDNYRFRNHILSLLDEQRTSVESWAHSVGAWGPAEPMDWQPEQERVVYIARDLVEYGCYEDRWRIGGEQQQLLEDKPTTPTGQLSSELVSWAGQTEVDGSTMCGAPVLGLGLVDGIE